jgi:acylphosphatase
MEKSGGISPSSPAITAMRRSNSSSSKSSNIGVMRAKPATGSGKVAKNISLATIRQSEAMASPATSPTPKSPPKPPILVRTKFVITGKVQGVYFRKFTQQQAVALGIFGTVRNEDDGSVTGVAEGRIEQLNNFKYWLQTKGSPKSTIKSADFEDEVGVSGRKFSRFDIDRT